MATTRIVLNRVIGRVVVKENVTGNAAIDIGFVAIRGMQLQSVSITFDAAPVTNETLAVSLDAIAGADYDATLYALNPAALAAKSIIITERDFGDIWLIPGDAINVTYANSDAVTYGVEIIVMEAG